jgi:hypothetical protein
VLERLLRLTALLLSGVLLTGFALFAVDEARAGTEQSRAGIADRAAVEAAPTPREERVRERLHGPTREAIDDVGDVLLAPFAWAAPQDAGAWARRGLPTLAALLVFGLGLGYLARFAHART